MIYKLCRLKSNQYLNGKKITTYSSFEVNPWRSQYIPAAQPRFKFIKSSRLRWIKSQRNLKKVLDDHNWFQVPVLKPSIIKKNLHILK